MSNYSSLPTTNVVAPVSNEGLPIAFEQTADVRAASEGRDQRESNYVAIQGNLTAGNTITHIPQPSSIHRGPPPPLGGLLNPYSTLYSDSDPKLVNDMLEQYFTSHGIDYTRTSDYTLKCYPYRDREQIPIHINGYKNPSNDCNAAAFALEFLQQAGSPMTFFDIFHQTRRVLLENKAIRAPSQPSTTTTTTDDQPYRPVADEDCVPCIDLSAIEFTDDLLAELEVSTPVQSTEQDKFNDLLNSFRILVNIAQQPSSTIKTQAVRGIVDLATQDTRAIAAMLESGALDILTTCITDAAELINNPEFQVYFDAASPERDMCHNAITGIANACEVSSDARRLVMGSNCVSALVQFTGGLSEPFHVYWRELVRESLRAIAGITIGMDASSKASLLQSALVDLASVVSLLEHHMNRDDSVKADACLKRRVDAIRALSAVY